MLRFRISSVPLSPEIMVQKNFSEVGSIDRSAKSEILEPPGREILIIKILIEITSLVPGCNELLLLGYVADGYILRINGHVPK